MYFVFCEREKKVNHQDVMALTTFTKLAYLTPKSSNRASASIIDEVAPFVSYKKTTAEALHKKRHSVAHPLTTQMKRSSACFHAVNSACKHRRRPRIWWWPIGRWKSSNQYSFRCDSPVLSPVSQLPENAGR
jgi:hypothetical protein